MCSHLHFVTSHSGPIIKKWIVVMQKRMWAYAQSCLTLRPHELHPARLLSPWDFPGKNTGVCCHFLLQKVTIHQIGCNGINPMNRVILIKWWQNRWEKQIEKSGSKNLKGRREIPILELVWNPVLQLRFPEFLPRLQGSPPDFKTDNYFPT